MSVEKSNTYQGDREAPLAFRQLLVPADKLGLSQVVPIDVSLQQRLPWSSRTSYQWLTLVSRPEAARLMRSASDESGPNSGMADWLSKWQLFTPYYLYWNGDQAELNQNMDQVRIVQTEKRDRDKFNHEQFVPEVVQIFSDPDFYKYTMANRLAVQERNTLVARLGGVPLEFSIEERKKELLGDDDLDRHKARFQDLVEIFYPLVQRFARAKSRNSKLDYEEWEAIAGLDLTLAATHFYWETLAIDPTWTVSRFIRSALKSVQDPNVLAFDSRGIEVHTEAIRTYRAADNTEAEVISSDSDQQIASLIEGFTESDQAREALQLRINGNASYPEIERQTGLSVSKMGKLVRTFKETLTQKVESGSLELPSQNLELSGLGFWVDLFQNIDKYRQVYDAKKTMLKKSYRGILELFFTHQTGDRKSTIDAILKQLQTQGKNIQWGSVRRSIAAGINQLNHKEAAQKRHGQLRTGWSRHQQSLLILEVSQQANIWESISEKRRQILTRFFIDGKGEDISMQQIAGELGLHNSTVSREIDRGLKDIYRLRGSIVSRGELAYKARNNLP